MISAAPDLVALIEAGLRAKPPRGDEHAAHMSDNICDLQTWYRRTGAPSMPHDFRTLVKFELGHQFERGVGDVLEAELSDRYAIHRDGPLYFNGLIGHADFIAKALAGHDEPDFLLEIKSTSFLRGKVPDEPAPWYVEQAAMYAAALNMPRFGILVGCRESGKIAPIFWFNLDDKCGEGAAWPHLTWRAWAEVRAEEIATATAPDAFPPPAEPRTSWACRTCLYAQCEANKNPNRPATAFAMEAEG
jgi:hypothetical protein